MSVTFIYGRRETGKSTFVNKLINENYLGLDSILLTPYSKVKINTKMVYVLDSNNNFDIKIIEILEKQKLNKENPLLIVLSNYSFKLRSESTKKLINLAKKLNIHCIFTLQYIELFPYMRGNIDNIYLAKDYYININNLNNIDYYSKKIYDKFGTSILNKDYISVYIQNMSLYNFMHLKQSNNSPHEYIHVLF